MSEYTPIEEKVMQAIGEASMCWSETPNGVFESERAIAIGKRLAALIKTEKEN
jgi:hypothetical protein